MILGKDKLFSILREVRGQLEAIYGTRLVAMYLYGSYARGEAEDDSDIDVAVVLEGPPNFSEEWARTNAMWSAISLRENCLLADTYISREDFEKRPYAIHRSIAREGIAI